MAVERRIGKAWKLFRTYRDALCDRGISFRSGVRYLSQTVGACLLYGFESVELTRTQLLRIRATHREMLRKMWGARWKGEMPDADDEADVDSVDSSSFQSASTDIVDAISYSEWLKFVTKQVEEEARSLGGGHMWEEIIVKRKFGWSGHLVRRGCSRRTARVLRAHQLGRWRARPGRPKQRWEDSMVSLVGYGWQSTATDRDAWRYFCDLVPEFVRNRLS